MCTRWNEATQCMANLCTKPATSAHLYTSTEDLKDSRRDWAILTVEGSDMSKAVKTIVILQMDSQSLAHNRASCLSLSLSQPSYVYSYTLTSTRVPCHHSSCKNRSSTLSQKQKVSLAQTLLLLCPLFFNEVPQGSWAGSPQVLVPSPTKSFSLSSGSEWDCRPALLRTPPRASWQQGGSRPIMCEQEERGVASDSQKANLHMQTHPRDGLLCLNKTFWHHRRANRLFGGMSFFV